MHKRLDFYPSWSDGEYWVRCIKPEFDPLSSIEDVLRLVRQGYENGVKSHSKNILHNLNQGHGHED